MRRVRLSLLLAGTTLALSAAPVFDAVAQSNSVRQVPPLPPTMQGPTQRNVVQAPPPAAVRSPQRDTTVEKSYTRETPPEREPAEPRVATPAPVAPPVTSPIQSNESTGFNIKGTLDKLLGVSDAQISEKLRALATGKQLDKKLSRQAERAAVEQLYAGRAHAPLWIKDGAVTVRGKATIERLKNAAADGLDARDYAIPDFVVLSGADAIAEADIRLTYSVLNFARHLQAGRIAPRRVTVEVDYGDHTPDASDIARKIADTSDINATLDSFNPPHDGFRALKAKLGDLLAKSAAGENEDRIADGPALKTGMRDARVPQLRQRLGLAGKPDDTAYDKKLAYAVKLAQQRAGLPPTGTLDGKALAAINGPRLSQQAVIVAANLERWRWLPRDLGKLYVMVNIPDYTLKVARGRDIVWRTKIVAGKPNTQTPLTSGPMNNVIVNPSWYVPQSIIQNELLPQYASDPKIFERLGLEVKRGPDGHINVVQPPGAANALGRIKFAFHNKFAVYLHDTPEKRLFANDRRAFSHGCMRVEDPTKFGEVILSLALNGQAPNSQQINAMYGHEEKDFKLVNRPQVHLTYQTAYVDDAGKLVLRDDIYGHDHRIHAILTTDERRIADVAPPADPKQDLATLKSNQDLLRRVERREASNPFVFFERLFR